MNDFRSKIGPKWMKNHDFSQEKVLKLTIFGQRSDQNGSKIVIFHKNKSKNEPFSVKNRTSV